MKNKNPRNSPPGYMFNPHASKAIRHNPFSHPDFHCRPRNLTGSTAKRLAGFTAGKEFHLSPKVKHLIYLIVLNQCICTAL